MPDDSPRLGLPFLLPAQAQKHVTHNEALERLDLLVQLTVEAFDANTPPTLPLDGQVWALGLAPSGVWAGQAGRLAAWVNGAWVFVTPQTGWRAAMGDALRIWDGSVWVTPAPGALDNLPGVGINASHDATNRLSVAADATLLNHAGAGHQLKLNKAAPADTASLLFQTGFSGRAEMGTAGSDAFVIKVSADGASWHDGAIFDPASGAASLPGGLEVTGLITGSAVTADATDTTPGRLLTTGAGHAQLDPGLYRQGNILGPVALTAGLPSGAVLDHDETPDGHVLRLADGTQLCWMTRDLGAILAHGSGSFSSPYRTAALTLTFPAAFDGPPALVLTATIPGASATARLLHASHGAITATQAAGVQAWRGNGNSTAGDAILSALAIGRWA
ncbi:MAG: DUF2793 domain-containing protein [Rhodobacteraceae bacterium]|nr:DUF2793 domain-containing protein [Paracoccaceae bacterium]MCC6009173.1 DUF2793 domain-containing protein [Paracoccaceae bacterium]